MQKNDTGIFVRSAHSLIGCCKMQNSVFIVNSECWVIFQTPKARLLHPHERAQKNCSQQNIQPSHLMHAIYLDYHFRFRKSLMPSCGKIVPPATDTGLKCDNFIRSITAHRKWVYRCQLEPASSHCWTFVATWKIVENLFGIFEITFTFVYISLAPCIHWNSHHLNFTSETTKNTNDFNELKKLLDFTKKKLFFILSLSFSKRRRLFLKQSSHFVHSLFFQLIFTFNNKAQAAEVGSLRRCENIGPGQNCFWFHVQIATVCCMLCVSFFYVIFAQAKWCVCGYAHLVLALSHSLNSEIKKEKNKTDQNTKTLHSRLPSHFHL